MLSMSNETGGRKWPCTVRLISNDNCKLKLLENYVRKHGFPDFYNEKYVVFTKATTQTVGGAVSGRH
jgi:hypothetical protein